MNENTSNTAPKVFEIIDGNTLMAQEYEPLRFAVDKIYIEDWRCPWYAKAHHSDIATALKQGELCQREQSMYLYQMVISRALKNEKPPGFLRIIIRLLSIFFAHPRDIWKRPLIF